MHRKHFDFHFNFWWRPWDSFLVVHNINWASSEGDFYVTTNKFTTMMGWVSYKRNTENKRLLSTDVSVSSSMSESDSKPHHASPHQAEVKGLTQTAKQTMWVSQSAMRVTPLVHSCNLSAGGDSCLLSIWILHSCMLIRPSRPSGVFCCKRPIMDSFLAFF